tara:strand:+ start:871 stop:1152 length:282 start_codon:yes stop_codon:yes gene_type:complete
MNSKKKKLFVLINLMILFNNYNGYYFAQSKQNSIIKLFCLNSFKEEMLRAKIKYREDIANKTCECYLDQFLQTSSHQNAITKCKLEAKENFKS